MKTTAPTGWPIWSLQFSLFGCTSTIDLGYGSKIIDLFS